jgi:hypothetical protein
MAMKARLVANSHPYFRDNMKIQFCYRLGAPQSALIGASHQQKSASTTHIGLY